jgi:hypothetical protein
MLFWLYSKIEKICCPRKKRDEDTPPSSDLPWVWIGVEFADGNVGDMTNEINSAMKYDRKVVDLNFLRSVVSVDPSLTWKYVDTKTLEEKEFPSTGLVIDGN